MFTLEGLEFNAQGSSFTLWDVGFRSGTAPPQKQLDNNYSIVMSYSLNS